jgi:hypothetical protein
LSAKLVHISLLHGLLLSEKRFLRKRLPAKYSHCLWRKGRIIIESCLNWSKVFALLFMKNDMRLIKTLFHLLFQLIFIGVTCNLIIELNFRCGFLATDG